MLGAVLLVALVALVAGPVASASASLTITSPSNNSVSNHTLPTFEGQTSEPVFLDQITVTISGPTGQTLTVAPTEEAWSVAAESKLADGEYTAVAEQTQLLETVTSNTVRFTVDTAKPEVQLNSITTPTGDTTPSFSGSKSTDTTPVIVQIHETSAGGPVVSEAEATNTPGSWNSNSASPALSSGTYVAIATQKSSLGNGTGESNQITFTVNTEKPHVQLNSITTPTGDTTPSFTGSESSDNTPVKVQIHETSAGGPVVSEATATNTPGSWSSGPASPALSNGTTYVAIATQKSSISGNGTGESNQITFTVNTEKPHVQLNSITTPTGDTTPSFTGNESSDNTPVKVQIHEGSAGGNIVSEAEATNTPGSWSSGSASPALKSGTYVAIATQKSSLGNGTGESNQISFRVELAAPKVTINTIKTPSNDTTPSFTGEASDTTPVRIQIHEGTTGSGTVVAEAEATNAPGEWNSGQAGPALASGTYTAVARQASSLGNGTGESNHITFRVDTTSPKVTLNTITTPSNNATPTFTGEATDTTPVTVQIHAGGEGGPVVSEAKATDTPETWHSGSASPSLSSGSYTAIAIQQSSLGNPAGHSNAISFAVNTEAPHVVLHQPPTPSNNRTPSFTGEASDTKTVHIRIHQGSIGGSVVAEATATGTGGAWSSGPANSTLGAGEYVAVAFQESSLGNATGESKAVSFTVNLSSPTVTLEAPESPSNNQHPTFSGFASDNTPVVVRVLNSSNTEVAQASAGGNGGTWSSGGTNNALGSGTYTAFAEQSSSLGNPAGKSSSVKFTIELGPPTVKLNTPKTPSNNTAPKFTGTASAKTPVTIEIHSGGSASGPLFATAAATGNGGEWTSGPPSNSLTTGEYTAVASQESPLLGNPAGVSSPVTFFVDTRSPVVTLGQPPSPSNHTKPLFSGAATDSTQVVVHIFNSASSEVESVSTSQSSGKWSTEGEGGLGNGSYTAIATQSSSLGNPQGESASVAFTINTSAPTVTLNSPALRSNNTTPSFTGTATDTTLVTVQIHQGTASGTVVSSATAGGTTGGWTSGAASPALLNGKYVAIASQPSSLGNSPGVSSPVTFEVSTSSPTVTLAQLAPSKTTTPTFTGTASETEPVKVTIFTGAKPEGTVAATATATGTGGAWTSGTASPALVSGTYTAVATQNSGFGNPSGSSAPMTFVVNTAPPTVTLKQVPKTPSNVVAPTFTGTATDTTPVVVKVYEGTKVGVTPITTASGPVTAGAWTSAAVSPALPTVPPGQRTYTAVAVQESSLGNPAGESLPITFVVDNSSPVVTITSPVAKSAGNNLTPTFSGTSTGTNASTEVKITIYEGLPAEKRVVSSAKATISAGKWTSTAASPALAVGNHTYTAVATQESLVGNPAGTAEVPFVVNTLPPAVTLVSPPAHSNNAAPTFTGTATDTTPVTVSIFEGTKPTGTVVAKAVAPGTGGAWTSAAAALPKGKHTYTAQATQPSSIAGNPAGASNAVTFTVDTAAPTVTLNAPPSISNNPTPSFSGSATELTQVKVIVHAGTTTSGAVAAELTANGTGGGWSTTPSVHLSDGAYTAVASQTSSFGEHEGESFAVTFMVDTAPPAVTLNETQVGTESLNVKGHSGTEPRDLQTVAVRLYAGTSASGAPVQSAEVKATSGAWSATLGGLAAGTYTVRAEQRDEAGNVGVSSSNTIAVSGPPHSAASVAPPAASFTWLPLHPHAGQSVSLVSSSTDPTSAITGFAWNVTGAATFTPGGPSLATSFATAGNHPVSLSVTAANGLTNVATETIPVLPPLLPLMQPFPVVRITSTGMHAGVRLRLLSVLAPIGARITVRCKGHGCPTKAQVHAAATGKPRTGVVVFKRFERSLPAGVTLEISITKAGMVGKFTKFAVRRGRLPLRLDQCLEGLLSKPIGCPTS